MFVALRASRPARCYKPTKLNQRHTYERIEIIRTAHASRPLSPLSRWGPCVPPCVWWTIAGSMPKRSFDVLVTVALLSLSCSSSGGGAAVGSPSSDAGVGGANDGGGGSQSAGGSQSLGGATVGSEVQSVVVGDNTACALISGLVYCWGEPNSQYAANLKPLREDRLTTPVSAIERSMGPNCALVGGDAYCWNGTGKLWKVADLPSGVTAISGGSSFNCAIAGGKVYCWGRNNLGQLGDGTRTDSSVPVPVQGLPADVTSIATGEWFACAQAGGDVYCWGEGTVGQLGDEIPVTSAFTLRYSTTPVKVQSLPRGVTALAAGLLHACALSDGTMYCWGFNKEGQLGDGTTSPRSVAAAVPGLSGVTAISAYSYTTCAVAGGVYCWGFRDLLGLTREFDTSPVSVPFPGNVSAISVGTGANCAIMDGAIYCWGNNAYGQLGSGSADSSRTPVKVDFSAFF